MRQFLISNIEAGKIIELIGSDFHYLVRVRRVSVTSILTISDETGVQYLGTVIEINDRSLRLKIGYPQGITKAESEIILVQGLSRSSVMDRIVRQVTELGIAKIVPVISTRTQSRLDGIELKPRIDRWNRIALQAMQQSGTRAPLISKPIRLQQYLEERKLLTIELLFSPEAKPLLQLLKTMSPDCLPEPLSVHCAVGPEGGFTPSEEKLFKSHDFHSVSLGKSILRTDTAAVASIAAVKQIIFSHE